MATGSRRPRIGKEFGIAHSPTGPFKNTLAACHPLEEEAGAPDSWKGDSPNAASQEVVSQRRGESAWTVDELGRGPARNRLLRKRSNPGGDGIASTAKFWSDLVPTVRRSLGISRPPLQERG